MNKKMQLSLLAIMLGTLTARGGGGGSSDNKGSITILHQLLFLM